MEIVVSNRHKPVSAELKDYVTGKVQAILEGKTIKIVSVKVVLDNQRNGRSKVEVLVNAKNIDFESDAETYEMNEAIDTAVAKIETQVNHYLDKKQDHHKMRESIKDIKFNKTEDEEEDEK